MILCTFVGLLLGFGKRDADIYIIFLMTESRLRTLYEWRRSSGRLHDDVSLFGSVFPESMNRFYKIKPTHSSSQWLRKVHK